MACLMPICPRKKTDHRTEYASTSYYTCESCRLLLKSCLDRWSYLKITLTTMMCAEWEKVKSPCPIARSGPEWRTDHTSVTECLDMERMSQSHLDALLSHFWFLHMIAQRVQHSQPPGFSFALLGLCAEATGADSFHGLWAATVGKRAWMVQVAITVDSFLSLWPQFSEANQLSVEPCSGQTLQMWHQHWEETPGTLWLSGTMGRQNLQKLFTSQPGPSGSMGFPNHTCVTACFLRDLLLKWKCPKTMLAYSKCVSAFNVFVMKHAQNPLSGIDWCHFLAFWLQLGFQCQALRLRAKCDSQLAPSSSDWWFFQRGCQRCPIGEHLRRTYRATPLPTLSKPRKYPLARKPGHFWHSHASKVLSLACSSDQEDLLNQDTSGIVMFQKFYHWHAVLRTTFPSTVSQAVNSIHNHECSSVIPCFFVFSLSLSFFLCLFRSPCLFALLDYMLLLDMLLLVFISLFLSCLFSHSHVCMCVSSRMLCLCLWWSCARLCLVVLCVHVCMCGFTSLCCSLLCELMCFCSILLSCIFGIFMCLCVVQCDSWFCVCLIWYRYACLVEL